MSTELALHNFFTVHRIFMRIVYIEKTQRHFITSQLLQSHAANIERG